MRSHALAALTTLLAAAAALASSACGETVDVGTFEDGTGGAGVGGSSTDTTSSGTPTGGPSTGATTGQGGDATTTTSSGPGSTTTTSGTGGGGTICGGLTENGSPVCADDEFCDYPDDICGSTDGTGICQPRPQACPFDFVDPVCSCDGEVYQSECFANLAGVDVSVLGSTCNGGSGACGGDSLLTCAEDEYCDYEPNEICGAADALGTCRPRPTTCNSDGPVACACDGQSYPSACEAARHGVDVWEGDAAFCGEAQACGGLAGLECDADAFCDFPNDLCGGDDGLGVCRPRPTSCPEPNADESVCGCTFGDAFGSECLANMAGQDISTGDGLECGGA